MPTAFLFASHMTSWSVRRTYRHLVRDLDGCGDVFWLLDVTDDAQRPRGVARVHPFSLNELNQLGYPFEVTHLVPGNVHLSMVHFAHAHPQYDRIWFIEYDVRFTGHWDDIVRAVQQDPSDFLTTRVMRHHQKPSWYWWSSLKHPTEHIPKSARLRAFNPFCRISRNALMHVHQKQLDGWEGHNEVLVTTLLDQADYRIGDMSGKGAYGAPSVDRPWYIRKDTFGWRPSRWQVGDRSNTLYHPVKPATWFYRSYRDEASKWLRDLIRPQARRLLRLIREP